MSKLSKIGNFLHRVGQVAPVILMWTPLAPIAPVVSAAIQEAEHFGGSGAEKLAHVKAIAADAAVAVNIEKGRQVVDPAEVETAVEEAAQAIVAAVNVVHN